MILNIEEMKANYLNNERIYLRAVEPEDLEIMYEMENDPAMWDVSSFTVPYSRYVLKQYIEGNQTDIYADTQLRLMIVHKADDTVLGTIDLTEFVPLHSRAAIGIAIHHNYRKEGYAKVAITLLLEYTFEFLKIHQVYAYISIENQSSIALFNSCGFMRTGMLVDWLQTKDGYVDAIIMQKTNEN